VDPDNRRPVDFSLRARLLAELEPICQTPSPETLAPLLAHWTDGKIKMFVTARGLALRQAHPDIFQSGDYEPLLSDGEKDKNAVAFARRANGRRLIAAVPRLSHALTNEERPWPLGEAAWGASLLILPRDFPTGDVMNYLTGEILKVEEENGLKFLRWERILKNFPVALLITT
jgi:(1->4)-alpha-D-glucan 1-alpha-D-glucosylmutase